MFDPAELNDLAPPEHLRQLPEDVVAELASIIRSEFAGAMPYTLNAELVAFAETRTRWDATRVSKALRHCYGKPQLAQEIDDALGD